MIGKAIARFALAAGYGTAGVLHIVSPQPFIAITPHWVPIIPEVIMLTGIAEIAGAIALVQPYRGLRRAGAIGLALYAVCVFPANINHMLIDMAQAQPDLGWGYHLPRMVAQPLIIWLTSWSAGVSSWPLRTRADPAGNQIDPS